MVTVDQIEKGIVTYLDTDVIPNLPFKQIERFAIGVGIALILHNQKARIETLKDNSFVKLMGIFDEEGNVDIDILRDEIKKKIPEEGMKLDVPKFGIMNSHVSDILGTITFKGPDIDKLYDYIIL